MQILLIAVGQRMPSWVTLGFTEYTRHMPPECQIQLTEIPLIKRSKGADLTQIAKQEAKRIIAAIPNNAYTVALDVMGTQWNTEQLAESVAKLATKRTRYCPVDRGARRTVSGMQIICRCKLVIVQINVASPLGTYLCRRTTVQSQLYPPASSLPQITSN